MKKRLSRYLIIFVLIAAVFIADIIPEFAVGAADKSDKDESNYEIQRAVAYGIVPKSLRKDYDKVITFKQYASLLNNVIKKNDKSSLSKWKKTIKKASKSKKAMTREDGILMTAYALKHMGLEKLRDREDYDLISAVQNAMDNGNDVFRFDYPLFPGWDKTEFDMNSNYMWGGIIMCAVRKSRVSGQPIYPYDIEAKTAYPDRKLTRREAICAVLRLAENTEVFSENVPIVSGSSYKEGNSYIKKFEKQKDKRRKQILNSVDTKISEKGTTYYVSNSGDDRNSGTSPQEPWQTLDIVNNFPFQPGDVILFKRGEMWRGGFAIHSGGVNISAYGNGAKPVFYGSPLNAADGSNWELFSENNGAKIWKLKSPGFECAGIVLDDRLIAKRVYSWYDGKSYYDLHDMKKAFDMSEALSEDLYFYCDIKNGTGNLPYYVDYNAGNTIDIYLRSDKGNPGELYSSIEFIAYASDYGVGMLTFNGDDSTVDNICIKYNAGTGISMTERNGLTVTNCEIGWCGNRLEVYIEPEEDYPGIWTDGNAIQIIASDCYIYNNYIHDCDGGGIVLELGGDITERIPFSGNVIKGNLVERCGDPLYLRNNAYEYSDDIVWGDIEISDNYVSDAGYGWFEDNPSYINPACYAGESRNIFNFYGIIAKGSTIKVDNNVFCKGYNGIFYILQDESKGLPVFKDNIFVQYYGKNFCQTEHEVIKTTVPAELVQKVSGYLEGIGKIYTVLER